MSSRYQVRVVAGRSIRIPAAFASRSSPGMDKDGNVPKMGGQDDGDVMKARKHNCCTHRKQRKQPLTRAAADIALARADHGAYLRKRHVIIFREFKL